MVYFYGMLCQIRHQIAEVETLYCMVPGFPLPRFIFRVPKQTGVVGIRDALYSSLRKQLGVKNNTADAVCPHTKWQHYSA